MVMVNQEPLTETTMNRVLRILAPALLAATLSHATVIMPTVLVGDAGNANDTTGFGGVSYDYRIGTTPVTNAQYTVFLNAVATTGDPHGLWHSNMQTTIHGGISRSGSGTPGDPFSYSIRTAPSGFNVGQSMENMPVNSVSFWDAARFVNWLTTGDTETGVYALDAAGIASNTITRDATAWANGGVAIASENEWYKAAYYNGSGGYSLYPTQSNSAPAATTPNSTNANSANYNGVVGTVTAVGGYTIAESHYGTFDQGGNVFEWNDATSGSNRGFRGGSYTANNTFLLSSGRFEGNPATLGGDNPRIPYCGHSRTLDLRRDLRFPWTCLGPVEAAQKPRSVLSLLEGGLFEWGRILSGGLVLVVVFAGEALTLVAVVRELPLRSLACELASRLRSPRPFEPMPHAPSGSRPSARQPQF
ncbi:MAG: SUMF1/EgtB/PvdO family nonheme iron enzyme [Opitutales bacterium]|nr:SUMF1/EgtB/PvdO family nonheme iron enzyme [Opitutales bacterium]